jgi:hypothetical protein
MRRVIPMLVTLALVATLGPTGIAAAGEPESYRYRSTSAYLDGSVHLDGARISLEVYGYESTSNGETTSSAGASIFLRQRRSGLDLHC